MVLKTVDVSAELSVVEDDRKLKLPTPGLSFNAKFLFSPAQIACRREQSVCVDCLEARNALLGTLCGTCRYAQSGGLMAQARVSHK